MRVSTLHFIEMVLRLDGVGIAVQVEVLLGKSFLYFDGTIVMGRLEIVRLIVMLVIVPDANGVSDTRDLKVPILD